MRFLVDNQLSPRLSRFLAARGHDSIHVAMVGLESADDASVWTWAARESRIEVSKDEDFLYLANRPDDVGRLLWVRAPNCRSDALVAAFESALPAIAAAFESGQRVVELA